MIRELKCHIIICYVRKIDYFDGDELRENERGERDKRRDDRLRKGIFFRIRRNIFSKTKSNYEAPIYSFSCQLRYIVSSVFSLLYFNETFKRITHSPLFPRPNSVFHCRVSLNWREYIV